MGQLPGCDPNAIVIACGSVRRWTGTHSLQVDRCTHSDSKRSFETDILPNGSEQVDYNEASLWFLEFHGD